jgi:hypothetical protein
VDDIRIRFRRTGGIAGVPVELSGRLDDLDLPDETRARLCDLLAGEDEGDVEGSAGPGTPDGFTYDLRIEQAGAARELRWTDRSLPADLAPAMGSLARLARPGSAGR